VQTCPRCAEENPDRAKFCLNCAAPLVGTGPSVPLEERKVVSVLFCDLVGFTAASEQADPEDVRARLQPYHARLREEIERFGGTVEKFVGDAVMAVFGAPVAYEDDAERAVRAGLEILGAIGDLNEADPGLGLQVRVAVNTGEVVVALGARPELGEGIVTGDVVNTASRIQGVAPVDGVAVSEPTYRQTESLFEYEELESVVVKGKAEPVALYRPLRARVQFGREGTRRHTTPLVGRELEKSILIRTFERAVQQRSCQLVTLVGEPGVGKSRLCAEFLRDVDGRPVDARPGLVRVRQGRCLPYGEGIAFWALGEVVKAESGILESDPPQVVEVKLEQALPQDDPDLAWLRARLQPLVGVGGEPASQEESFTAWRRVLASWAARRETVLVFEDLHWADEALLEFLEHLADWAEDVQLLVLCTARPELYDRHQGWAGGLRNATTINLPPLTDSETATLVSSLLERAVLPVETQEVLIDRAGGNPLYAEEFVRLLGDRGQFGEAVEMPLSVQALIAARLDTLPPERKALLQDASVVGRVFWAGALAEMGKRDRHEVELVLHELARKELVRPARSCSMEGETEYGFWHVLVRDVCYQQIPRAGRAARHQAAAAWLERKAGDRIEDFADVLAHHYATALELARAVGQREEEERLETAAIQYLVLAGERALALDVERAELMVSQALALLPAGHRMRASLLECWARAVQQQDRLQEARAALEEALALPSQETEPFAIGRALTTLSNVLWRLGDPGKDKVIEEAIALLGTEPPSPELVAAFAELSGHRALDAAYAQAISAAEEALTLAGELGLPEPVRALGYRGAARVGLGQRQGLDDLREALALAIEQGHGRSAAFLHNNLAAAVWLYEGPRPALAACEQGIEFCKQRGIAELVLYMSSTSLLFLVWCGRVEQALAESELLIEQAEAARDPVVLIETRSVRLRQRVQRGEAEQLLADAEHLATSVREVREPQLSALGFVAAAQVLVRSRPGQARTLLTELADIPQIKHERYYISLLPESVRCALDIGDTQLAAQLIDGVEPQTPLYEHSLHAAQAHLSEASGEMTKAAQLYAQAARSWNEFENVPERARALLGKGRCLLTLGDAGAEVSLAEARDLFTSMGYKPALNDTQKLLEQALAAGGS
jgi:class 3 adenylate cyclase/tetratricopeptide (TPR) repeat protein